MFFPVLFSYILLQKGMHFLFKHLFSPFVFVAGRLDHSGDLKTEPFTAEDAGRRIPNHRLSTKYPACGYINPLCGNGGACRACGGCHIQPSRGHYCNFIRSHHPPPPRPPPVPRLPRRRRSTTDNFCIVRSPARPRECPTCRAASAGCMHAAARLFCGQLPVSGVWLVGVGEILVARSPSPIVLYILVVAGSCPHLRCCADI